MGAFKTKIDPDLLWAVTPRLCKWEQSDQLAPDAAKEIIRLVWAHGGGINLQKEVGCPFGQSVKNLRVKHQLAYVRLKQVVGVARGFIDNIKAAKCVSAIRRVIFH